jgi:hypothetical protein
MREERGGEEYFRTKYMSKQLICYHKNGKSTMIGMYYPKEYWSLEKIRENLNHLPEEKENTFVSETGLVYQVIDKPTSYIVVIYVLGNTKR